MSAADVRRLFRSWQQRLGLERWRLELILDDAARWNNEVPDNGAYASLWRSDTYEHGRVYLSPEWRTWPRVELEVHLVHELVHLLTRDVEQVAQRVEPLLHPDAWRMFDVARVDAIEQLVDGLAVVLVHLAADA